MNTLKKNLNKPLQEAILLYTFVNHHATYRDIIQHVKISHNIKNDQTIRSALNSLINKKYIERIKGTDDTFYQYINRVIVDDIDGLEDTPSVKFYLHSTGRKKISETDYVPSDEKELLHALWIMRGTLIFLAKHYTGIDDEMAITFNKTLGNVRSRVKPDVENGNISMSKQDGDNKI